MQDSMTRWLDAGYLLLATEGPDAIQIERLARVLNLNKSGFYHHFGARDVYLSLLMKHHEEQNDKFNSELAKARNFDPDVVKVSIKHKTAVMVQMQLRKHSNIQIFQETFKRISRKNEKFLIPLWAEFIKIPDKYALAIELYEIFRDVLFIRITSPERFEPEIQRVTLIFSKIVSTFLRHSRVLSEISEGIR
jgi:AcrR family transcriptional regulator